MFSVVLLAGCRSEKTLSEQIKYDWDINYNSSKDDGGEKQYNLNKNLTNSSLRNQTEDKPSLQSINLYQDFLASKDKVESSVSTNN